MNPRLASYPWGPRPLKICQLLGWLVCGLLAGRGAAAIAPADGEPVRLEQMARAALDDALNGERNFVRIHAAEAWIALGEKARIHRAFQTEAGAGDARYRVGVWRVLAQSAPSAEQARPEISRIEAILDQPASPEWLLALESLNKLRVPLSPGRLAAMSQRLEGQPEASLAFLYWAECIAGDPAALSRLAAALNSPSPVARLRAAYVLRYLEPSDREVRIALARAARIEPAGATTHAFMVSAALALEADPEAVQSWRKLLNQVLVDGNDAARYEACQGLMKRGDSADLPRLATLLAGAAGDARIGLAWAILRIRAHSASGAAAEAGPRS